VTSYKQNGMHSKFGSHLISKNILQNLNYFKCRFVCLLEKGGSDFDFHNYCRYH
jgi:hypothetical protein